MNHRILELNFAKLATLLSLGLALIVTSCINPPRVPHRKPPVAKKIPFQNPYPPGTHAHFMAEPSYLKTSRTYKNYEVLQRTNPENSSIIVSLRTQRAMLMNGEEVAMDYPVSTGTANFPTPPGEYKIREMLKDKRSNQYGKILDAEGKIVVKNATMPRDKDKIPEGGEYLGASMPYWMRLTWSGIGMHVGRVPRYPASHACIRGQSSIVPIVFSKVKLLTPVRLVE